MSKTIRSLTTTKVSLLKNRASFVFLFLSLYNNFIDKNNGNHTKKLELTANYKTSEILISNNNPVNRYIYHQQEVNKRFFTFSYNV